MIPSHGLQRGLALLVCALIAQAVSAQAVEEQQALASAEQVSRAFAIAARAVIPAVVNISTTTVVPGRVSPLLREFFGREFEELLRGPDREVHSLGSGCLISAQGHVITNAHVVQGAQQITVTLADEREFEARLVGMDPATDLAIIKIEGEGLPFVRWGDSSTLQVGEWVLAIGSPFGLSHTVTAGIVSATGRSETGIIGYEDLIQTDAAINPGNSGGPLVNLRGELVGINTAIASQSGGSVGVGFAVPSALARSVAHQLIESGRVVRGWIGIIPRELTDELIARYALTIRSGVFVEAVYRDHPAVRAGIAPGDVITMWGGEPVTSVAQLGRLVANTPPGSAVTVTWRRGNQQYSQAVTVAQQPVGRGGRPIEGI
ncbi:MAG: S1C family serine protease [Armatimonadota bacterium]